MKMNATQVKRLCWKGHLYLGLFLLAGIWLFALSGLMLNHPKWSISGFWNSREQAFEERTFDPLTAQDDNGRARELIDRLGLAGELEQVRSFPGGDSLTLTIARPGTILQLKAWPATGKATLESTRVNAFGAFQMLHTATGVRIGREDNRRDWLPTRLWGLMIDAVSLGMALIVLSGCYLAFSKGKSLRLELLSLGLGLAICLYYLLGLPGLG